MSPLGPARAPALTETERIRLAAALEATAPRQAEDRPVGGEGRLPVPTPLAHLVPGAGLARGQVAEVADPALMLALAAAAVRDPDRAPQDCGWLGVVAMPALGLLAATGYGIDPARILLADHPGQRWHEVVAALAGAVELVLLGDVGRITPTLATRLTTVLRRQGTALLTTSAWPGSTLRLEVTAGRWFGLGDGHGLLSRRQVRIEATGRGAAAAAGRRSAVVWLPGDDGALHALQDGEECDLVCRPPAEAGGLATSVGG